MDLWVVDEILNAKGGNGSIRGGETMDGQKEMEEVGEETFEGVVVLG